MTTPTSLTNDEEVVRARDRVLAAALDYGNAREGSLPEAKAVEEVHRAVDALIVAVSRQRATPGDTQG